ncbi:metallophosphoesterase family protein [Robbsia sp. Bb-Pol-6]|uniref:Metallophosphoesterase family protein n=1 Tax=Robbsia betulipollinis TaxID=2981849 RepID=A0ABT3ZN87_9BURK|nr:metallophosphoesterase family protein [Robbsia betulipollinis]MCY0387423.1 metallophosphoesterase family protein [Robbsia betulipollinis]
MRVAAISDIHGNLPALQAILGHIRTQNVDLVVNLGDIASGSLYPSQTGDFLSPLGYPTIKGNHERQLLAGVVVNMGESDAYTYRQLRQDQLEWIENLPTSLRIAQDVLLVHGTPASDLEYFLETVTSDGCRQATQQEVEARAGTADGEELILCGHTHIQRSVQLSDGRLVVNPGSVGLQAYSDVHPFPHKIETGSPHARYAIATRLATRWTVEFHSVEYDWASAADVCRVNGRPSWATPVSAGLINLR